MLRKTLQVEKLFDTVNVERFAYELANAVMLKLKASNMHLFNEVTIMLSGEYPEDINKQMMDKLVRDTLSHLSENK